MNIALSAATNSSCYLLASAVSLIYKQAYYNFYLLIIMNLYYMTLPLIDAVCWREQTDTLAW